MTPENKIGTNSNTVEAVNPLYEKGQERFDTLKQKVSNAKASISSWFSKGKSFFTSNAEKAAVTVLSTPEIASAAADKVEQKVDAAKEAMTAKYNEAQQWVGNKKEQAFNWANDKKEQVVQFGKDTVEISAAVAMIAAETASEKYTEVKESVKAKAVEVKEKIQSKWERLLDYGKIAIAAAEAKRQVYIEKRNAERNAKLIEALMQQLQMAEANETMAAQLLEASKQRTADLRAKIDLQQSLFNPSLMAA